MRKSMILLAMTATLPAIAEVHLNPMIGSNMIIQQQTQARLWGKATPGATVEITPSWSSTATEAKADRNGNWAARIDTPAAGFNSHTITFTDRADNRTVTVDNVLVGDVWLASGQSNMQMPLKGYEPCPVNGGFDEVAASASRAGSVRFLTVPLTQSYTPMDTVAASWQVPSPQTAPEFSAAAWHFAKRVSDVMQIPVGIVCNAYGGAKVESYLPEDIVRTYPDISLERDSMEKMEHYLRPVLMYNAMFNPVKNYTYKGILWYQGCSNVDPSYATYADRLTQMVERWRKEIGQGDIPFYAVEVAPFDFNNGYGAYLREAQWDAIGRIPESGMIGTNDLVMPHERFNVHPAEKRTVGTRLANLALSRTYGQRQFPVEHPSFKEAVPDGSRLRVTFDVHGKALCRNYDVQGFEIAGADKVFHPATVEAVEDARGVVVLSSPDVPSPVHVRYCFGDFRLGTLYGPDFLPAIPFRSDR